MGGLENHLKNEHSVKDDVVKVMLGNLRDETAQNNMVCIYTHIHPFLFFDNTVRKFPSKNRH